MLRQRLSTSDLHELAASYALGALDSSERVEFEDHLKAGCPSCEAELLGFSDIVDGLTASVVKDPPPKVRRRLLADVSRMGNVPATLPQGVMIARSAEVPWRPMFDGVETKLLHIDRIRRYSTTLVRMGPGARLPRHRHEDVEELYILSGDLSISGEVVRAGDYCRANPSTVHEESFSETGCLFLLMASQHDEMLA